MDEKNVLNEWKSASDDTVAVTMAIGNEIIRHSNSVSKTETDGDTQYLRISSTKLIPFKEGHFYMYPKGRLGDLTSVKIEYVIYYCNDEGDVKWLNLSADLNCCSDYYDKYMKIVTYYIGDTIYGDFLGDVSHEVNHLLQYGKGAAKNEDLYELCKKCVFDKTLSAYAKSPAYLIYYTFRHEEDSFAVQFYHYLKERYKEQLVLGRDGEFERAMEEFPYYKNIMNCYNAIMGDYDNPEFGKVIERMRMTKHKWQTRVDNGIKRLRNKFRHAYERLFIELGRPTTIEGIIKNDMHLSERHGKYILMTESTYDFA